jgi:adenylosuccinate lyase
MLGALLRLSTIMCANLEVDRERMLANLRAAQGYIFSEGVMLALARHTGKQTAHDLVYATAMAAVQAAQPLEAAISENAAITAHLSAEEIAAQFDINRQLGLCPHFVDRVVAATIS